MKRKHLTGRDAKCANAFLRSVVFNYDSRWMLEREGEAKKACEIRFKRPFTSSYMPPKEREAYHAMFAKEVVFNLQARWLIECDVVFNDGQQDYIESGQIVTDVCGINEAMPAYERLRDELKSAGNPKHYRYYTWKAQVYKDQELYQEGAA